MKKLFAIVFSVLFLILLVNFVYYRNLYSKQVDYITTLLNRQVQIAGLAVDNTNLNFLSDLNRISFTDDLVKFFTDPANEHRAKENMKLFYSKYQDFITGIRIFDNKRNEYTLKKDEDWLDQKFFTNVQNEIITPEGLFFNNRKYEYVLPVISNDVAVGNIVVSIDFQKYFEAIFVEFNLKDYQWQWVVGDTGEIIFNNSGNEITYLQTEKIIEAIESGIISNMQHKAVIDGNAEEIISSYYSTQLITRDLGLVFSAPMDFFQKYIIRNSIFIVTGTILLILVIIYVFWYFIKSARHEASRLAESEKTLHRLIDEMPVGVVIHKANREIIKANKVAAEQYSYSSESEMKGRIFPESSIYDTNNYFSKTPGTSFNPEQFVIITKDEGEMVLYRNSIPVVYLGEAANMDLLIDVTMLEAARKQESKANVAKSEFLSRMSFEMRTQLNAIIGMTDILNSLDMTEEVREIVTVLRKSTEVLLNIITDILDFSKIENGKMILDDLPFSLRDELIYCAEIAKTCLSGREVSFSYIVDDNVPESIIADQLRLRQILTNIISHSASGTESGEIKLLCRLLNNNGGIITLGFELLDTGQGYDKASLKKIFGDSVSLDSKSAVTSEGSGFATILARQLVQIMGGELTAVSPSGLRGNQGTKVSFSIVAYSNDRMIKNLDHQNIIRFDQVKTLVICGQQSRDEELLGFLHKTGLNISVTNYQKSTSAQIAASLEHPDDRYNLLVIFDDSDLNGFNVVQELMKNKLSESFIVIMVSANDLKGNYLKSITMGVDHYFVMPFDPGEFRNRILDSFPFIESKVPLPDQDRIKSDIRILVVEDNKINQKVMSTMLRTIGYSCDIAGDGSEGLMMAGKNSYDLVFMDLIMPVMNGFEAARKILEADRDMLIVALSADNMPDAKRKAELSGIREFIAKPVRIEVLKNLLARYFRAV
jgi:signal transduction histidine kinase/CheY-like chemotaxis protein